LRYLAVIVLTVLLLGCLGSVEKADTGYHFYMYGMKTCPHCANMKAAIVEYYGEDSLTYYELVDNDTNMELFMALSRLTGITGVPAIAITENGTLYVIVEGEFDVRAVPDMVSTARANRAVLVLSTRSYMLPYDDPEARKRIEALYAIFVEHRLVNETNVDSDKDGQ